MKNSLEFYKQTNDRRFEIKSLKKLTELLTSLNIKHWVDFGTLLGSFRQQNIIEWDVDMDVSCIIDPSDNWYGQSQINLLWKLQEEFYVKYFWKDRFVSLIPKNNSENFQLRHIDLYLWSDSGFFITSELLPNMSFRSFFIDELDKCIIGDESFLCPRHTDLFLKMRYGNNWNVPDKSCCVETNILPNKNYYICYTSMVGDLFHQGHINLLKRCKQLFDKVIVGIHNDEQVISYKERPHDSYEIRLKNVINSGYADEIIEDAPPITTNEFIDSIGVDFVVAGREDENKIQKMYPIDSDRLHLIKRTDGISSSILRKKLMFA